MFFNSFAGFNQGQSAQRITFNYEIASGSPIVYQVTNNIGSAALRRTRLELPDEGFADADSTPLTFLPTTTAGTASIVFDRKNMMQWFQWITSGSTDTIVGELDLSTEETLRDRFSIAGHDKLTGIRFANEINPTDKTNSGITLFQLFNNDLREIDMSPFKNIGEDASTASLQIFNNFNCSAVTFPTTNFRTSVSMRNLGELKDADFSTMPACQGIQCNGGTPLSSVTFPTLISAATGTWNFDQTNLTHLDYSVLGPNFGARIDLFQNSLLTGFTAPACQDSVVEIFIRGNGFASDYKLDLTPISGVSGDITIRNQSLERVLFGPSSNTIDFFYMTANGFMKDVDLSMLEDIRTTFWCHGHGSCSAVTLGNWTNPFTTFYMFNYDSLPELMLSGVTGLGGQVLLHQNDVLTATTLPTTTNMISEIWFYDNPLHGYFDMKPISGGTNDDITLLFQENNSWGAEIKNHILHDLDNFGWTNGYLAMSGGTAGYDTTSGGYNGYSHLLSLSGKGWTIAMTGLTS